MVDSIEAMLLLFPQFPLTIRIEIAAASQGCTSVSSIVLKFGSRLPAVVWSLLAQIAEVANKLLLASITVHRRIGADLFPLAINLDHGHNDDIAPGS